MIGPADGSLSSSLLPGGNPVDMNDIREQLDTLKDWKRIAQCSVCEFRLKSHVLIKCMHVFCKECLDVRLETRQRKCPTCGLMFGPNDLKQIYI